MPSIKHKQRIIAEAFQTKTGFTREIFIPWQSFQQGASAVSGMPASVAASLVSGCISSLAMNGTKCTCVITVPVSLPQDAALMGATAAAGSGVAVVYFADDKIGSTTAVVGASLYEMASGSAIGTSGASALMAACAELAAGVKGDIVAASVAQFNGFHSRSGTLALKLVVNAGDANNTTGSNFHLLGVGLRYKADRLGS